MGTAKGATAAHKKRIEEIIDASEWILDSIENLGIVCRMRKHGIWEAMVSSDDHIPDIILESLEAIEDGLRKHSDRFKELSKEIVCSEKSSHPVEFYLDETNGWELWPIVKSTGHEAALSLMRVANDRLKESGKGDSSAVDIVISWDPLGISRLIAKLERESILLRHFLSGYREETTGSSPQVQKIYQELTEGRTGSRYKHMSEYQEKARLIRNEFKESRIPPGKLRELAEKILKKHFPNKKGDERDKIILSMQAEERRKLVEERKNARQP